MVTLLSQFYVLYIIFGSGYSSVAIILRCSNPCCPERLTVLYPRELKETAAQYGVRAMPTFMSFRNGVKIEEFSGADPGKLEDTIKRLAGAQAAATGPIAGHVCSVCGIYHGIGTAYF